MKKLSKQQRHVLVAILQLESFWNWPWWNTTSIGAIVSALGGDALIRRPTLEALLRCGVITTELSSVKELPVPDAWETWSQAKKRDAMGRFFGLTDTGRKRAEALPVRFLYWGWHERLQQSGHSGLMGRLVTYGLRVDMVPPFAQQIRQHNRTLTESTVPIWRLPLNKFLSGRVKPTWLPSRYYTMPEFDSRYQCEECGALRFGTASGAVCFHGCGKLLLNVTQSEIDLYKANVESVCFRTLRDAGLETTN